MPGYTSERSVVIHAPVEVVYDYVSDFPRHVEWNHQPIEMTKLTDGPVGIGSKFRTQEQLPSSAPWVQKLLWPLMKRMLGVTDYTDAEITALESKQRVAWKAVLPLRNGGIGARSEYELRLRPQGDATLLTQYTELEFLGKIAERMNVDTAAKINDTEMERNLARLKEIVEAQTASGQAVNRPAFT